MNGHGGLYQAAMNLTGPGMRLLWNHNPEECRGAACQAVLEFAMIDRSGARTREKWRALPAPWPRRNVRWRDATRRALSGALARCHETLFGYMI